MTGHLLSLLQRILFLVAIVWMFGHSIHSLTTGSGSPQELYLLIANTPLLIFAFELIWILLARRPLRTWSPVRLLSFNTSRETDGFFWIFFRSGLVPISIAAFPFAFTLAIPVWMKAHGMVLPTAALMSSFWLAALVVFFANSFLEYVLHWTWHRVPEFWQLHQIHHAAEEMTGVTQYREHLVISSLTNVAKGSVFGLLGIPLEMIGGLLILKGIQIGLQHSQVESHWGWFGKIFISPRAHHIHHSIDPKDHHANFGFDITLWDRIFGTYRMGEEPREIGLPGSPIEDRHVIAALWISLLSAIQIFLSRLQGRSAVPAQTSVRSTEP